MAHDHEIIGRCDKCRNPEVLHEVDTSIDGYVRMARLCRFCVGYLIGDLERHQVISRNVDWEPTWDPHPVVAPEGRER